MVAMVFPLLFAQCGPAKCAGPAMVEETLRGHHQTGINKSSKQHQNMQIIGAG
jgi:hypothetical protein